MLLAPFALLSRRAAKLAAALLLIGNAIALYFINTYGVLIDRAMMGNVLSTDWAESSELLHPMLGFYVLVLGLLPAALLWRLRLRSGGRLHLAASASAVLLALLAWLYAASGSWLWLDQHAKRLGGLVLPWSYLVNTVRYASHEAGQQTVQRLLPDAALPPPWQKKRSSYW